MAQNAAKASSSRAAGSTLSGSASVHPAKSQFIWKRRLKATQSPPAAMNSFTNGRQRPRDGISTDELGGLSDWASSQSRSTNKMAAACAGCATALLHWRESVTEDLACRSYDAFSSTAGSSRSSTATIAATASRRSVRQAQNNRHSLPAGS
ncbi:unnamed protein product [Lampetra planeri]